jgi:predicted benzoate:H+ symporter BenE
MAAMLHRSMLQGTTMSNLNEGLERQKRSVRIALWQCVLVAAAGLLGIGALFWAL